MTFNDLAAIARNRGIAAEGTEPEILVPSKQFDALLDILGEHGVTVLGFEGLDRQGSVYILRTDLIADFSLLGGETIAAAESISASRNVVAQWWPRPDFITVVLAGLDPVNT